MKALLNKFLKIAALVIIALFVLAPAGLYFENWRGKRAWESYKAEQEAKGEHLDYTYFVPPDPPEDQNLATTPLLKPLYDHARDYKPEGKALNKPNPPINDIRVDFGNEKLASPKISPWMIYQMVDLQKWRDYYRAALPGMPPAKSAPEDVLAALDKFDGGIEELREAIKSRPIASPPQRYGDFMYTSTTFVEPFENVGKVLALRAVAELSMKHPDMAFADVQLGFALMESSRQQKDLFGALFRVIMFNTMMQPVWEGLVNHNWTDAQLVMLEAELRRPDFLADYEQAMRTERALGNFFWDQIRKKPELIYGLLDKKDDDGGTLARFVIYFSGWVYQNQLFQDRFIQDDMLPLADEKTRRFDPAAAKETYKKLGNLFKGFSPYTF